MIISGAFDSDSTIDCDVVCVECKIVDACFIFMYTV